MAAYNWNEFSQQQQYANLQYEQSQLEQLREDQLRDLWLHQWKSAIVAQALPRQCPPNNADYYFTEEQWKIENDREFPQILQSEPFVLPPNVKISTPRYTE